MLKFFYFFLFSLITVHSVALPSNTLIESFIVKTVINDSEQRTAKKDDGHPNICTTDICVKESTEIINSLNVSVDPCDNFYEFVCGKYNHDTVLPEDKDFEYTLSIAQDQIDEQLHTILSEDIQPNEPKSFQLAKTFYQLCTDMDTRNKKDIQFLMDILEPYGGWPVVKGDEWNSDSWNWLEMSKNMSNDGLPADFIFGVYVTVDSEDTAKHTILLQRASPENGNKQLTKDMNDVDFQKHLDEMIQFAKMSGASEARAKDEMLKVLEFEQSLVKSFPCYHYEGYTIEELNEDYPHINWTDFFNWNLNNLCHLDENEDIALYDIKDFIDYVENLISKTSKRTIANYIGWRFIEQSSKYLNDDLRKLHTKLSTQCIYLTRIMLPIATGALYVQRLSYEKSRDSGIDITMKIYNQFIETLKQADWMDIDTRDASIAKAKAMKFLFGYSDKMINDTLINEYYKDLDIQKTDLFLNSVLRIEKFQKNHALAKLRMPAKIHDWTNDAYMTTSAGAEYYPKGNYLHVTTSFLQSLSADRPAYINYGSSSFLLADKISRVLDNRGRQYDINSNEFEWWSPRTINTFEERAKCYGEQYSNYLQSTYNYTLENPKCSLDFHINQNVGIEIAYAAYQEHVKEIRVEPMLPGLDYTPNQLFWISATRSTCIALRPEKFYEDYESYVPYEFSANGPLSNSERFSHDFNCKVDSSMNPANKCELW